MNERLQSIDTKRLPPQTFFSPALAVFLQEQANQVARLYQGIVARRSGKLAGSATPYVTVGGHRRDRLIGKVVVGTDVEYAALHEFGAKSNPKRRAAKDLAEAVAIWKGTQRA